MKSVIDFKALICLAGKVMVCLMNVWNIRKAKEDDVNSDLQTTDKRMSGKWTGLVGYPHKLSLGSEDKE